MAAGTRICWQRRGAGATRLWLLCLLLASCTLPAAAQDAVLPPSSVGAAQGAAIANNSSSIPASPAGAATDPSLATPTDTTTVTAAATDTSQSPAPTQPPPSADPIPSPAPVPSPSPSPPPTPVPAQRESPPAALPSPSPAPVLVSPSPPPPVAASPPPPSPPSPSPPPSPPPPTPPSPPPPSPPPPAGIYSLLLSIVGTGLVPWSEARAAQTMKAITGVLSEAGIAAKGSAASLYSFKLASASNALTSAASGRRRRLAATAGNGGSGAVAAIPSVYSDLQTAGVQVVVEAPGSTQVAIQAAIVAAATSGMLASDLRLQGMSVSQVTALSIYPGSASPPTNLSAVPVATVSPPPSTQTVAAGATPAAAGGKDKPKTAEIVGIAVGASGFLVVTVGLLLFLRSKRAPVSSSDEGGQQPSFDVDVKKSPPVRRTLSTTSVDLEGGFANRYRQPMTPRHAAHRHSAQMGLAPSVAGSGSSRASAGGGGMPMISVHVTSAAGAGAAPPSLPQTGSRIPSNIVRTMATVASMQEARRNDLFRSQQAAEQAAMREYLKSKPPQVMWEDEAGKQHSQYADFAARSQRQHTERAVNPAAPGSHASRNSNSFTNVITVPSSRAVSEAGTGMSDLSSEIEPVVVGAGDGTIGRTASTPAHSHHSGRSSARSVRPTGAAAGSWAGSAIGSIGGGSSKGDLPEHLKRSAARVQSGSPRSSAARAKGPFVTKDHDGVQPSSSRLGSTASAPSEPAPATAAPGHDRSRLTGAWVASGGRFKPSQVLEERGEEGGQM